MWVTKMNYEKDAVFGDSWSPIMLFTSSLMRRQIRSSEFNHSSIPSTSNLRIPKYSVKFVKSCD